MNLYNNEIMAYSISRHPNLAQVRERLDGLGKRLPDGATPLLHSDQGWQYQLLFYTIGVLLSISSALASSEPRDYRGVFVYTKMRD